MRAERRRARRIQEERQRAYEQGEPWGKFEVANQFEGLNPTMDALRQQMDEQDAALGRKTVVFINRHFQVNVLYVHGKPRHLSIKLRSNYPIRSWRDFQRIKNELVGPEAIAVEVYPPESELVDGSNQYHLWVVDNFPGFHGERMVCYETDPDSPFHRQEPLPADFPVHGKVMTVEEIHERERREAAIRPATNLVRDYNPDTDRIIEP